MNIDISSIWKPGISMYDWVIFKQNIFHNDAAVEDLNIILLSNNVFIKL